MSVMDFQISSGSFRNIRGDTTKRNMIYPLLKQISLPFSEKEHIGVPLYLHKGNGRMTCFEDYAISDLASFKSTAINRYYYGNARLEIHFKDCVLAIHDKTLGWVSNFNESLKVSDGLKPAKALLRIAADGKLFICDKHGKKRFVPSIKEVPKEDITNLYHGMDLLGFKAKHGIKVIGEIVVEHDIDENHRTFNTTGKWYIDSMSSDVIVINQRDRFSGLPSGITPFAVTGFNPLKSIGFWNGIEGFVAFA